MTDTDRQTRMEGAEINQSLLAVSFLFITIYCYQGGVLIDFIYNAIIFLS